MTSSTPLLQVKDLSITFGEGENQTYAVKDLSFDLHKGETLSIVGESGSGKSVTALSILQLLPYPLANHPSGSIHYKGQELVKAPAKLLRKIRGNQISMIFQEPMTSLNPLHSINRQISESLLLHQKSSPEQTQQRTIELLKLVQFPDAEERLSMLPHQLSGGQRQRVMIAMALACEPDILIADEPTTALDVTTQAEILKLLRDLQNRFQMSLLMITHDLKIVETLSDRVLVMKDGIAQEIGTRPQIFSKPKAPYTKMLLAAEPEGSPKPVPKQAPQLLNVNQLSVHFPIHKGLFRRVVGHFKAVEKVSFSLRQGETIGIVGESGSGKTTLAMALLQLIKSTGDITFNGQSIQGLKRKHLRPLRRQLQIVFQDPFASLNPRFTIRDIIGEGLKLHKIGKTRQDRDDLVIGAMREVELDPHTRHRYPHEFSGGQRQRIALARAFVLKPQLLFLDEPTSALDRAVQKEVIELLRDLQAKHHLSYVFISHDLKVVQAMSHQVLVMKDGEVVESGLTKEIYSQASHPYTQRLFKAAFEMTT